jgi:DNA polymerase III epsilon subunit-like protein
VNQISVIRVADGFQKTANIAVDFPNRANPDALRIQKKAKHELKIGVPRDDVVEELDAFFEEDGLTAAHRCIVGHSVAFDRRFCHAMWAFSGKEFKADLWLCTRSFAMRWGKRIGPEKIAAIQEQPKAKYSLDMCMKAAGLPAKFGAHSATIDTQNTLTLFNFLMDKKLDYVSIIKRVPHKTKPDSFYE